MRRTYIVKLILEKPYSIQEIIPEGFVVDFSPSLFNLELHRTTQQETGWQSYYLLNERKKKTVASVHFCIQEGIAHSSMSAPYGSFEFSSHLPSKVMYEFITDCEQLLKKKKVRKMIIRSASQSDRATHQDMIGVFLLNKGFSISTAVLSTFIPIDHNEFYTKISLWEKKKLRQSVKNKLRFRCLSHDDLYDAYHFIAACRAERGHTLSMTFEHLRNTIEKCSDYFFLFGIYHDTTLVAASIAIRTRTDILYNFYPAHARHADALSPVVMLTEGMYNWCRTKEITTLDLGTSSCGGLPNFSLLDFKLRLGAVPAMKLTFEKQLT